MALAVDATSSSSGASVNSLTWSHTCSGSDRVLVVLVGVDNGISISGITYNGVSLTQVGTRSINQIRNDIWKLSNPSTGTNNIVVSLSGTCNAVRAGGISFTDASGNVDGFQYATNGGNVTISVSVTSQTGNFVIGTCQTEGTNSSLTIGDGQTSIFSYPSLTGNYGPCASSYENGASSVTFSYTVSSNASNILLVGANVEQKSATNTTNFFF